MKRLFIPILIVFILASLVSGLTDYSKVGGDDGHFEFGTGFFNELLDDTDEFTKSISDPIKTPLIADLDNDGTNEIILLDDATFRLYQNKELDIIDAFTLSSDPLSNFIASDIDNDTFIELIVVTDDAFLNIIEYNGTAMTNISHNLSGLDHLDGEMLLNCRDIEDCFLTFITEIITPSDAKIFGVFFNSTTVGAQILLHEDGGGSFDTFCFPQIPVMQIADYDGDNDDEYIFSFIAVDVTSPEEDEDVLIFYVDVDGTTVSLEQNVTITDTPDFSNIISTGGCAVQRWGVHFTNPLVFDIDGSSSNGLETVVGFMIDDDEFVMHSFSSNGNFLDDYPEIFETRGRIVSNVILTNAFPDTSDVDFCVMGYSDIEQEIRLLCASEQTGKIPETQEFNLDIDDLYNVTDSYETRHVISHSGQHTTRTTEGNNLDEIVNSYGVLEIDWTLANELLLIFENPKPNAVVLAVDVEKAGRDDLVVLTNTNLWYIDDGFSTSGAVIDEYCIDPCIDATWKQNTTVQVLITPTDIDGDQVRARAILYNTNDTVLSQDAGWSALGGSGTTFTFNFIANETVGSDVLLLQANDTSNPTQIDEIEITFSVGVDGVVFGECETCVTGLAEIVPDVVPPNCPDGVVDDDEECDDGNSVSGDGCSSSCTIEDGAIGDEISTVTNTPERFQPLMAGIIIIVIMWMTITVLAEKKIVDGMALIYIPIATGIVTWIILATPAVGMIPGWTVIIGILFSTAFIGFKVYQNRSPGGAGGI